MALNLNLKKDELLTIAEELGLVIPDKAKILDLKRLIESSDEVKTDIVFVRDLIKNVLEEKRERLEKEKRESELEIELEKLKLEKLKRESEQGIELEKLKLAQLEKQLEIANIGGGMANTSQITRETESDNLESLIKSVKVLSIPVPNKSESFNLFFNSLEKAFENKTVPNKFKAEILLNILGERVNNLLVYVSQEDLCDYEKIKNLVLKEFEPTPQECLNNFKRARKLSSESYVQFASRLCASFDYYCHLRKVADFKSLCDLIVSDKIFETLDRELMSHIGIKQGETFFHPQQLGRECDIYLSTKGKTSNELTNKTSEIKRVGGNKFQRNPNWRTDKNISKVFVAETKPGNCVMCRNVHPLSTCPQFRRLSVHDRVEVLKKNYLCFRCFSPHKLSECRSVKNCFCSKPHHKMIHFPRENANNSTQFKVDAPVFVPKEKEKNPNVDMQPQVVATSLEKSKPKNVLLSTVRALVKNKFSEWIEVRCLLDVGSQSCLCTRACAERLQLKMEKINTVVSCVNDATMVVNNCVRTVVANKDKSYVRELSMLVVNKITDLIPSRLINVGVDVSEFVSLADDSFNVPGKIDMLLGAEVFYELLKPEQFYAQNSKLLLQNSVFGYVVSGSIDQMDDARIHCGLILDDDLNKTLKKFWEIEEIGNDLTKNEELSICEEHYARTHSRDKTGRYTVLMPFKEHWSCLGNSKVIALKRLESLWTRLSRDQEYLNLYRDFLKEYEELGHMTEIKETKEPEGTYYMPHLGIYRPQKSTTKLRTVFNASTPTTSGKSLNSIQYNGGVIQDDLFSLLLRFRKHIFAFTADIRRMYRMINIDESQRALQRILWKEGTNEPIKVYQLNTVTYGTVSAPYLAMRTLKQISIDEGNNFPIAATVLSHDLYMDDVLSGAETLEAAKTLQHQLIDILKTAQMTLHKWCGNTSEIIPATENEYDFTSTEEIKTLGIAWKARTDCFNFKVEMEQNDNPTKRSVLSVIARLFDPLGLLGPVITKAKIFMQNLWLLKIDWNERLPLKEAHEWQDFVRSLLNLNDINIERCIVIPNSQVIELYGFCDASEKAYGAAVYARSINENGDVKVKLVTSKSRVSPIKQLTIPRLELCSAVLLIKLMQKVKNALKMDIASILYFSDSTIVLAWMKKEPRDLKTFVANRVVIIQEFSEIRQWHHIPTEQNPADIISRGLDPKKIQECDLWWFGPSFLCDGPVIFPSNCNDSPNGDLYESELKNIQEDSQCFLTKESEILPIINKCSSFTKLIRIIAWCVRFKVNVRNPLHITTGNLTASELSTALLCLVRNVQSIHFQKDIQCIEKGQQLPNSSNLLNLSPFLDSNNILRVGGRLRHSNLPTDQKHPILIPNNNPICELIINHYHVLYLHTGAEATLANIRTQFWLLNGKSTVKKVIRKCLKCLKVSAKGKNQCMADLPCARVTISKVFTKVGLDFCGPFIIKLMPGRVKKVYKCYICIFICFVVKAVHLEIVNSLSTEAFINAFKRFIARRGRPIDIFSDNGTNFVGANNEFRKILKNLFEKENSRNFEEFLASEGINWHFNPPATPHFGGLWEAGVKSLKGHLKRVVGNTILTHEEFCTLVTQVEAVLNSRPLCPLSEDPNDEMALTPAHFLIGSSLTSVPELNFKEIPMNKLSRWELVQKLYQTFWCKWSSDYLNRLQARPKWCKGSREFKENEIVLVKDDDSSKILNWKLAKIIKIHPGDDNIVRVVTIKTNKGIYKRPVNKIVKLPIDSN